MSARCLPVLLLTASLSFGDDQFAAEPPPVKLGIPTAASPELPPLLVVPEPAAVPVKPCRPCANDYHSGHTYLPDKSPDCATGNCNSDCGECQQFWLNMSFFCGRSDDLGVAKRQPMFGFGGEFGYWLEEDRTFGLQVGFFSTHGWFREVQTGPWLVDAPVTLVTGNASARFELFSIDRFRFDGLAGYEYVQLHEKLLQGKPTFILDQAVRNQVNGGRVGMVANYRNGPYFAEALGSLTVGRNDADIQINGTKFKDTPMTWVPEFGMKVGYQLGESLWTTAGYSLVYLRDVCRPGVGVTHFTVHGITVGFEYRF